MTDLAAFLLERIAEDEAAAREVHCGPEWGVDHGHPIAFGDVLEDSVIIGDGKPIAGCVHEYGGYFVAEHIARWDPARVLADCEARRRIVAHEMARADMGLPILGSHIARLLALPYANHPAYDSGWRP